ncbi:MAG: N-formylglutamate amidohydrolase [Desulfuromonas sp.]|nr:MAG: N-formylglutamate amidohydrolase [Desulfuromonas sp.]
MPDLPWRLLLSCEHGGNRVPPEYATLFQEADEVLASHRGYDIGVAPFARRLAQELSAPLYLADVTRLLVELNRSPGHPALFSEFSRELDKLQRRELLAAYYQPHRERVISAIERIMATGGRVLHLSLHSFTPELHGEVRNADIGLLYDPQRPNELALCRAWQAQLRSGTWRIRRNYPYRGTADGFIPWLRRRYPAAVYCGVELEINQRWPLAGGDDWETLQRQLGVTLAAAVSSVFRQGVTQDCRKNP